MVADKKDKPGANKLGKYLVISDNTISNFINKCNSAKDLDANKKQRIGEVLVDAGLLTQQELDDALKKQRSERLSKCPIFASLSSIELVALSKCFTEVSYGPNEIFIMQGDDDPSLFIIASGLVEVFRVNNAGDEISIAKVGTGQPIGEMGYFSGEARTACVRALEETQLLKAQYRDLTSYFENAPKIALAFMKMIEKRKKELDELSAKK